jgi:hypothetical protein
MDEDIARRVKEIKASEIFKRVKEIQTSMVESARRVAHPFSGLSFFPILERWVPHPWLFQGWVAILLTGVRSFCCMIIFHSHPSAGGPGFGVKCFNIGTRFGRKSGQEIGDRRK